jgi:hypothetical protein
MYQLHPRVGAGLGLVRRTNMFAAIDNTVTLPGYTDVDAAVYITLSDPLRAQVNAENLFNRTYYVNADNNTNISPGSPRALRFALVAHSEFGAALGWVVRTETTCSCPACDRVAAAPDGRIERCRAIDGRRAAGLSQISAARRHRP